MKLLRCLAVLLLLFVTTWFLIGLCGSQKIIQERMLFSLQVPAAILAIVSLFGTRQDKLVFAYSAFVLFALSEILVCMNRLAGGGCVPALKGTAILILATGINVYRCRRYANK